MIGRAKTFWLFAACLALLSCAGSVPGQVAPSNASIPKQDAYGTLLAKLKEGDTKIDFTALRMAYSETSAATAEGASHRRRAQMTAAVIDQRCDEAIKIADEILESNYLSPDTHIAKSNCYRVAGNVEKADFHKAVYLGLINSILASGDGKSLETAFRVFTIEEEYAVMRALGLTVWRQQQGTRSGHAYEILSASNDKTSQTVKVYFNIDIPAAILNRKVTK